MANNVNFAKLGFKNKVDKCNQLITFCRVGYHGQNSVIEICIGKITVRRRIILFRAKSFWPEDITYMFWPFAAARAIHLENTLTLDASKRTPI